MSTPETKKTLDVTNASASAYAEAANQIAKAVTLETQDAMDELSAPELTMILLMAGRLIIDNIKEQYSLSQAHSPASTSADEIEAFCNAYIDQNFISDHTQQNEEIKNEL